jgi:hypothetical protein
VRLVDGQGWMGYGGPDFDGYGDLFFVSLSESVFLFGSRDEGGFGDPFFCLVRELGRMNGYNHPFIRGGEYTPSYS